LAGTCLGNRLDGRLQFADRSGHPAAGQQRPDNFQYQVSNVKNFTGTRVYTWQVTGTKASVNQATTVTAGTITLVIRMLPVPKCTISRSR
jgi:hypothetical protein